MISLAVSLFLGSGFGIDLIRALVYGCSGLSKI